MHLKLLISFLLFSNVVISQYSNYYNVYNNIDINQRVNINQNVNVNKTITTIDYGKLMQANIQRERNRFEIAKYNDNREKEIILQIASNPLLAYDYGFFASQVLKDMGNFKKFTIGRQILHKGLFSFLGNGKFENISDDGIKTQINMYLPTYFIDKINIEDSLKYEKDTVGKLSNVMMADYGMTKVFLHKKDLSRATVYGVGGFVGTRIWEDDYEYAITDTYSSITKDGISNIVRVRYTGNKKDTNFEKIEGRRYYLRAVIEKMISTSTITDYKFKK